MTGYELVKFSIYEEAWIVSKELEKEPANKQLQGAWKALLSVMEKSALLDEFNEWRDKKYREQQGASV